MDKDLRTSPQTAGTAVMQMLHRDSEHPEEQSV